MVPQRWGTPYSGAMTHWSWTLLFAHKLLFNSLVFASAIFWLFLPWIYRWAVKLGVTVFGLWFRRPLPLDSFFSFSFLLLFLLMIGGSKISWFTPPCFFAQPYATLRFHKITQRKKNEYLILIKWPYTNHILKAPVSKTSCQVYLIIECWSSILCLKFVFQNCFCYVQNLKISY